MPVATAPPAIVSSLSAVLRDPNTGAVDGRLSETCDSSHTRMFVSLAAPYTLTGTERLEIHVSYTADAAVRVSGQGGTVVVVGFGGRSRVGCIAAGQPVTLDSTPGGLLGSLLVLIARGTMQASSPQ